MTNNFYNEDDLIKKSDVGLNFQKLKKFDEAEKIYQTLITDFSSHFFPFYLMGTLKIEQGDLQEALTNLEKSLFYNKKYLQTYINLSYLYFKNKDYLKTEEILKNGIYLDHKNLQLKLNLSQLYLIQGKLKKVIDIDYQILKINPNNYFVINRLHDLGQDVLTKQVKLNLKEVVNKTTLPIDNQIYVNFLLSKYENKISRYKQEYNYLSKAHDLIYQVNKVYFQENNSLIFNKLKNIHNYFDEGLALESFSEKNKNIRPIFIFGLPRSGSTLIEKIILKGAVNFISGEETRIFNSLVDNIYSEEPQINILQNLEKIDKSFAQLMQTNEMAISFTDKSLNNFFFLGWIKKLFPNAKFINCKRDPYIIISSILRNNLQNLTWAHKLNDIMTYIDIYQDTLKKWQEEYGINYYEVNYADLIDDFESETQKLFEYCKIDWSSDLINFNNNEYISYTASNIKIRERLSHSENEKHEGFANFLSTKLNRQDWIVDH